MTIAQQLNIKIFPFKIHDSNGNLIYRENSRNAWEKYERDSNGRQTYKEKSNGYWSKREYFKNGDRMYYENSLGDVIDNRPINWDVSNHTILKLNVQKAIDFLKKAGVVMENKN